MKLKIVTKEYLHIFKKELLIELYKTYEVMKMLNISKCTLQTFRANDTIPFTRLGKCMYFKYADILKLSEANTIQNPKGSDRGFNRFSIKNNNPSK